MHYACRYMHATHVAYVNGGAVTIQERPLNADDWRDDCTEPDADFCDTGDLDYSEGGASGVGGGERLSPEEEKRRKELRRQAGKVPGIIKKLEAKIADAEEEVAALDEAMYAAGADTGAVMDLLAKKEPLQEKIDGWYADWEKNEELLAMFPDVAQY